jgi:hypothetical protein
VRNSRTNDFKGFGSAQNEPLRIFKNITTNTNTMVVTVTGVHHTEWALLAAIPVGPALFQAAKIGIAALATRTEFVQIRGVLREFHPDRLLYIAGDRRQIEVADLLGMSQAEVCGTINREARLRDDLAETVRKGCGYSREYSSLLAMHALPTDIRIRFIATVSVFDMKNARLEHTCAQQLRDALALKYPRIMREMERFYAE